MGLLEIVLPGIILVLAFILKLFVDRTPGPAEFVLAVLEFPVDVMFLAMTLIAAFAITTEKNSDFGVAVFAVYVVFAIISVFLWRRSHSCLVDNKGLLSTSVFAGVAYVLGVSSLVYAIALVMEPSS